MIKLNKTYNLDAREGLDKLDAGSIDCVITSPPYWGLRDYGIPPSVWGGDPECEHEFEIKEKEINPKPSDKSTLGIALNGKKTQYLENMEKVIIKEGFCSKCGAWKGTLGLEPNFELYIKHLCNIYDKVWRVLKKSGTCWVNLGDCYAGSGKGAGYKGNDAKERYIPDKKPDIIETIKSKCLMLLPQRFAIEMVNRGWILRNVIVWHKPNAMPSSARDRFTVDFEYVYFFVKSKKYWFEQQRVPSIDLESIKGRKKRDPDKYIKKNQGSMQNRDRKGVKYPTRNKRTVWTINTQGNKELHFASFPPKLVEPMILSGCPEFICMVCGKPREKILEKVLINTRPGKNVGNAKSGTENDPNQSLHTSNLSIFRQKAIYNQLGYTDCECEFEIVKNDKYKSGVVLDIFAGTGTTLKQAWRLGRNYIGFEISKEYCEIANRLLNHTKNKRLDVFI